jgi:hypothetical protein
MYKRVRGLVGGHLLRHFALTAVREERGTRNSQKVRPGFHERSPPSSTKTLSTGVLHL